DECFNRERRRKAGKHSFHRLRRKASGYIRQPGYIDSGIDEYRRQFPGPRHIQPLEPGRECFLAIATLQAAECRSLVPEAKHNAFDFEQAAKLVSVKALVG